MFGWRRTEQRNQERTGEQLNIMSSRRGRGKGAIRLQRAMKKQQELEGEFKQLETAQDPTEVCAEIIAYVTKSHQTDPLLNSEENPFCQRNNRTLCTIL